MGSTGPSTLAASVLAAEPPPQTQLPTQQCNNNRNAHNAQQLAQHSTDKEKEEELRRVCLEPPEAPQNCPQQLGNTNNDSSTDSDSNDVDSDVSEIPPPAPTQPDEDSLEPWKDWIKRCTYYAEEKMRSLGIEDWVTIQRRRKWKWARRVATDTLDKWTLKTLMWDPTLDTRHETRRHPGRPYTRWSDDITNHITQQSTQHNTTPNNYDNTEA